eukprot:2921482-Amphidinium_carterae.1
MQTFSGLVVTVANCHHDNLLCEAPELKDIAVENNWSDASARLVIKETLKGTLLNTFFKFDGAL